MALYVRRDEDKSELQKQIQSDLRAKAKKNGTQFDDIEKKSIDGVDDSGYMDGTEQSSSLLGLWVILLAVGVTIVIFLVVQSSK